MNTDSNPAKAIFLEAVERHAPDQWPAFLDRACAGQPELRGRVEALLVAHREIGTVRPRDLADSADAGPVATDDLPCPAERSGAVFGPYKLLEQVGEGGMGTVWMAQQTEPVKRLVALKLIKAGMDSRQVIARFEAERQALALMDHPNIARVLDAGTTGGRPYFVMDLVKGVPITRYCDEHRLTTRQRLELFLPVCQAVQHAHQKGIIHRDLKPSNVLVALYDGRPVPKVIDFGVAKAAGQPLTERTLVTGLGAVVGTPEYMSPEQAELNQLDIDTRSDIYSLGILLYELLTGTTPLTHKRIKEAALLEVLRVIREEEPQKPSTRISTTDELPSIAANRGTEPARLSRLMRGELDWIVMKSLEKDRSRRYETANGFAMDVQRYLADEPVQACPPSVGYRFRKLVRRNRGPVAAASLVVLTLIGGIIGTTIGLVRADQRAGGERRAKEVAEKRLVQIERGIDVLGSLFADLDPFAEEKEGRPLRAILRDRLDQTAAALEGEAIGDPLIVARLQDRLGQTYLGLGSAAKAEALFSKAVATRQAELGPDHPLTLASWHNQALALEAAGKRIEAIKRFELVRDARVKVLGADHLDTLSTLHELAVAYYQSGKPIEAVPLLEKVRDGRVKLLGENDDLTLATLQMLALAYPDGKNPEAIALAEKVRDARVRKHGDTHPHTIQAVGYLANVYQAGYKMRPARELLERTQEITLLKLGPYHPLTLKIQRGLGQSYRAYMWTPRAITLLEEVRQKQVMVLGGHHPGTLITLLELGAAYVDAGERGKALQLFEQAATGVEKLEYQHAQADRIVNNLASCHEQLEQYDKAEVWRRKWVAVAKEKYGPESFECANFWGLAGLGSNLVQQQKYADAEPILRESLTILQKYRPETWETCRAQSLLGVALLGQRKYADAEPHFVQAYQGMNKLAKGQGQSSHGSLDRQNLIEALERLVQFYDATNRPDEAAKWRKVMAALNETGEKTVKPKGK